MDEKINPLYSKTSGINVINTCLHETMTDLKISYLIHIYSSMFKRKPVIGYYKQRMDFSINDVLSNTLVPRLFTLFLSVSPLHITDTTGYTESCGLSPSSREAANPKPGRKAGRFKRISIEMKFLLNPR